MKDMMFTTITGDRRVARRVARREGKKFKVVRVKPRVYMLDWSAERVDALMGDFIEHLRPKTFVPDFTRLTGGPRA